MRTRPGRLLAALALGCTLVVGVVVVTQAANGGGRSVRLVLDQAYGLENGSPVMVGGVRRGTVALSIGRDDQIDAELRLDSGAPPIDRGAQVAIVAANLLGQKRVEVYPARRPIGEAPDEFVLPGDHVTTPTDLDQLLAVMDADTRTRAAILINELGTAVLGRRTDIQQLLAELPGGISQATRVVDDLEADNDRLRTLVAHAHGFVEEAARRRTDLTRLIDAAATAADPLAQGRGDLDASLREAPTTLVAAKTFLARLTRTAAPLGHMARDLTATAGPLRDTLAQVKPLTASAAPTLDAATHAAPKLAQLGREATPDLRQVQPAVTELARLSKSLVPVSETLNHSSDNALAILENWARAIQFRDSLGHVFRGEASFSADAVRSAVGRLAPSSPASRRRKDAAPKAASAKAAAPESPKPLPARHPEAGAEAPDEDKGLGKILGGLRGLGGGGGEESDVPSDKPVDALLDFLLEP